MNAPHWRSAKAASVRTDKPVPPEAQLSLGIIGLPIDVDHDMLKGVPITTFCFTSAQPSQGIVSLCEDPKQPYENFSLSGKYNLCDFDPDCWHSTAVAIIASGKNIDWNRYVTSDADGKQTPLVRFKTTTLADIARSYYENYFEGEKPSMSFAKFISENFDNYRKILNKPMQLAAISYNQVLATDRHTNNYNTAYISNQMIIDKGVRTGGGLLAINVFSRFASAVECDDHKKPAPCALTTIAAQEEALKYVLQTVEAHEAAGKSTTYPLGAIVIVAGAQLTKERCDNTRTAELIGALRQHGVLTFVPVGNDGDAARVRFPACATKAISVGALDRDGAIALYSNGSGTRMVNLYADGDTVVIPIRGPRLQWDLFSDAEPESCDSGSECSVRRADDQYDTYLAGGTLLSASAVAAEFLNLRERHPTVGPEDILIALMGKRASSRSQPVEADEYLAEQLLAHP
jgi:hypothetical protein